MRLDERMTTRKRVVAMLEFMTIPELAGRSNVSTSAIDRIKMGFSMRPATAAAIGGAWATFCQQQLEQGKC